jgi:sigma-E factor negative regulatory protein RseC
MLQGKGMPLERGIVQHIENDWAWVLTRRTDACSTCQHKGHCHIIEGMDKMMVRAKNAVAAEPGDEVALYLRTKTKLKGMFILYIFPVLGLLLGAFSAASISDLLGWNRNMGMVSFTLLGLVLAFLLARFCAARMEAKDELTPRVSRIIRRRLASPLPLKPGEDGCSCSSSKGGRPV